MATFGKIYGAVICLSGFFNFFQAFLDTVTFRWYGGDPRPANILLLVLSLIAGVALAMYLKEKSAEARRNNKIHIIDQNLRNEPDRYGSMS